ncbi:MAG: hypothetical protein AB1589_04740 [Cyanobacteriota bacterium]
MLRPPAITTTLPSAIAPLAAFTKFYNAIGSGTLELKIPFVNLLLE